MAIWSKFARQWRRQAASLAIAPGRPSFITAGCQRFGDWPASTQLAGRRAKPMLQFARHMGLVRKTGIDRYFDETVLSNLN